ncbi:MAG: hypothetical protein ACTS8S_00435 [Giesbergeria sp.]
MNPSQLTEISIAICNTIDHLCSDLPEPTRTALQAHLDVLLKAELQALTRQAPDADLTEKTGVTLTVDTSDLHAELCRIQATILELKADRATGRVSLADVVKDPLGRTYIAPRKDAIWYPDDSGEWVEGHPRDLPRGALVSEYLYETERETRKYEKPLPEKASHLYARNNIIAYKVVKP